MRRIRTAKDGHWFCFPDHIERDVGRLYSKLAGWDCLRVVRDPDAVAGRAAHRLAELYAIHPCGEGNGRGQLTPQRLPMDEAGFAMDQDRIGPGRFMAG